MFIVDFFHYMIDFLNDKFKSIDLKIKKVITSVESNAIQVENQIQKYFDLEFNYNEINRKRESDLEKLDKGFKRIIKYVNKKSVQLSYLNKSSKFSSKFFNHVFEKLRKKFDFIKSKYEHENLDDNFEKIVSNIHKFGLIKIVNELNIYKKFYYFNLCQTIIENKTCPIEYNSFKYECFFISRESYLINDLENKEFILLNKKKKIVKKIRIKENYTLSVFKLLNSRLYLVLYNSSRQKKLIVILDYNLKLLKSKTLDSRANIVCSGPSNLVFQCSNQLLVLDSELDEIERLDQFNFRQKFLLNFEKFHLVNLFEDHIIVKDFSDSLNIYNVKIVSRETGQLNSTIQNLNFFLNRLNYFVKTDLESNIFIVNTHENENNLSDVNDFENVNNNNRPMCLMYCYNKNGQFMFSREIELLNNCYYIDFIDHNLISFNYLDHVDLL